jgi:thioredoxin reductase
MRLTRPDIRPVGRPVSFRFDGRPVEGLEGESIAAALAASGIVALRQAPSGAPRGVHCGMGACWDCVVTVDGRIGQRACMTQVADGMEVASGFPDVLAQPAEAAAGEERACDVLVVGGGVAGLSAAAAAAEAGAGVVLLDERAATGGQYAKPLAPAHAGGDGDARFGLGAALLARALKAGVRIESGSMVWGAFAADEIAAIVRGQAVTYRPRRLVLATGAHEAPVPLPGWTLPGVLTTGGLQGLVRSQMVVPGARVLIAGNGPLNLQVACDMVAAGVKPVAVLEAAGRPGVLSGSNALAMSWAAPDLVREGREMLRVLRRAGVPVLWRTRVERLEGEGRVQRAIAGGRVFEVDAVALNMGFQPETGLARALGAGHRLIERGASSYLATMTDEAGRTSVAGVFSVGDGAGLGGARVAQHRGRLAGAAAARELGFDARAEFWVGKALRRAERFQDALWRVFWALPSPIADETVVCRCEEVTAGRLRAEIAGGLVSLPALKKATRAGMGRCQGRFCAATVAGLCPGVMEAEGFAAPRAPLRPVPVAPLMREAAEFVAPLLDDPAPPAKVHALPPLGAEERRADVVVIGGGAAGLSTAYFLAKGGADVLVVDRDEAAMAASTANAGSLHVQLFPYDLTDDMPDEGGPAVHRLGLCVRSIALWKEIGALVGEDLGIRTEGGLMLAEDEAGMAWLRRKSAVENRYGIESHVLGSNELRDLAPALSERMVGADFVPAEGYGDPLRGMMAISALVRRHGGRMLKGAEVLGIAREGSGWAVSTSKGVVRAGRVVNAAGPWAGRIGRMAGVALPVTGTVQQVIVTEPAPVATRHLVALAGRHLSLKQSAATGGFLIGGGWFGGFDAASGRTRNLRESIEGNLWVCERALPMVKSLSIVRSWTGINPAIDGAPLLGEVPGLDGFYTAVTATGYTLGPVVGQVTAAAILEGEAVDPRFTLARFG